MSVVELTGVPRSPFRGLSPFGDSELDAFLFFGREREAEVIAANLMAAKLTVLYGPSGVGKTSVVRAGVTTRLRAIARENLRAYGEPGLAVAVVDGWSGDAVDAVRRAADAAAAEALGEELEVEEERLPERLAELGGLIGGELYLVLDQFEEFFLYHADEQGEDTLADVLPELVMRADVPVSVLVALREDALAQIDAFKARIPGLFANSLRLDRLDRRSAREAVLGPIDAYNALAPDDERVEIEPALVEGVLDQVAAGRIEHGRRGRGIPGRASARRRVEAPYLQLVLQRVWDAEREAGSRTLRLGTLEELGGAERIVERHLERALARLSAEQRDAAAAAFHYLVTPSGTKIAHAAPDLARYAGVPDAALRPALVALAADRVIRPLGGDAGGEPRFEIFHDVLTDAVLAWRERHETERTLARERAAARRRHQRVLLVAGIALAGLATMTAVAVYALTLRSEANEQERAARARELSARALVQLESDPQESLELALKGAELEASRQAEVVLRRTLLEARLRRVVRVGTSVPLVSYSPDGSQVLLAQEKGGAVILDARGRRVVRTIRTDSGPVVAAQFAPSGRHLLTAQGRSVAVWDSSSGSRITTIEHRAPVTGAAFSADGTQVVSASEDGAVQISGSQGGKPLHAVRERGIAKRALLAPDGRTLVTVAEDRSGHVQSRLYRDGRFVRLLDQRGVADVEFSPDGKVLATSNYDGATQLWDAGSGASLRTLSDEGGPVVDVAFSPDGALLATASSDGAVRVWRVATGDRFFFFIGHTSAVSHVVFDPSGTFVISTSGDRTARVWRTAGFGAGAQVALLVGHQSAVLGAAVSPDGRSIVTGGADGTVRIWDGQVEQRLEPVLRGRAAVTALDVSSRGRHLVAGDAVGTARVLGLDGRRVVGTLREAEAISDVAFSPAGTLIASATEGRLRLWRPSGAVVATLRDLSESVDHVRFAPDGKTVAAATSDTVRIWRMPTGEPIATLEHEQTTVQDVALSGRLAATAGFDGVVRIWDTTRGRLLHELRGHEGPAVRVAFSPTGDVVASAGEDGTARLWSADGAALSILRGHGGALTDVGFDRTGTRLVTTGVGSEKNAMVWDVRTGRRLHDLVGHFGTVTTAGFSSDGRWIVTAGPISAGVWPADTGRLLFYLRGHTDLLTSAAFSPRGYDVLTSARDGTVRIHHCELCVRLDGLITLARARVAAAG